MALVSEMVEVVPLGKILRSERTLTSGVHQGPILFTLGTILFILFVNDLVDRLDEYRETITLYAYNTLVSITKDNEFFRKSIECMERMSHYSEKNGMMLNAGKTPPLYVSQVCRISNFSPVVHSFIQARAVVERVETMRSFLA
ncbi:hypothetical protein WA026_006285 [Henosepilachna vigintioctopunctata]|uniref:Reverse transcriptase domain-containing protein n=1 Tax=Henosepilachna vigintioctopunctata TaxID=420089 RepID=A0AAW1TPD8_9CUCU